MGYEMKQVIVMRKDLGMRAGKMCSQAAHASMAAYLKFKDHEYTLKWLSQAFAKITVRVESEDHLMELYQMALDQELPCALVTDAGRTEFHGVPTKTCICIGPAPSDIIDKITGDLKLL